MTSPRADGAVLSQWTRTQRARESLLAQAAVDPVLFCSLVLRDEQTGQPIRLTPTHERWHALISKHPRLILWSHVEAGKTVQVAVGRVLYELGREHSLRVAIVSNTHGQASKIVRTIGRYIERGEDARKVTGLRPGYPWRDDQLFVRRSVVSKDPSVQGCGVHGNILGSRIDLLVLDDVLDYENARTPRARTDLYEWYLSTLSGRLTADSRVIIIGNAYHPDDLLYRLARSPGWEAWRFPVVDERGVPTWPERWPPARIARARLDMGPLEFARQLLCQPRDDTAARFKEEWIQRCLEKGRGRSLAFGLQNVPAGCRTVTGVDLAVQQHSSADLTVLTSVIAHPNGDREVLCIESGRWAGPDIVARIVDHHRRYNSLVVVENNAAQQYLVQFTRTQHAAVPIRGFTTGRNKAHPEFGVESIAAEMAAGRWIFPNDGSGSVHPELAALINEMRFYDPAGHTGDRLMSMWFAREGDRMARSKAGWASLDLMTR